MFLYNTLTRKKEKFTPLNPHEVKMYCCGPTVYNYAHIGNLRTYIFEDILRRVILYNGYKLKHVMNITDVGHLTSDADFGEDKMLKGAKREGKTVWEIAKFYTDAFMNDLKRLNIQTPDILCKATDHIQDMINLIKLIEKNGFTYIADGNVYFDVAKFKNYGKLAKLNLAEQKAGARINIDKNKKNPHDFVLWFTKSKFLSQEMKWESPWGLGYPGWHIECSAMSIKYLGEQFDIHCGGIDHISIHHTNEIAQSEAATKKTPWVKYWLHGEFLVTDKEKMSKSSNEFLTTQTLIDKGYDPLIYRYFCFNAHYRQQLSFSFEGLQGVKNAFNKLKEKIIEIKKDQTSPKTLNKKTITKYQTAFKKVINDDMNMPQALSIMWTVIKDNQISSAEKLTILLDFDQIFGFGFKDWQKEKIEIPEEIKKLIQARETARKEKNWTLADKIRNDLLKKGIELEDTPTGTIVINL